MMRIRGSRARGVAIPRRYFPCVGDVAHTPISGRDWLGGDEVRSTLEDCVEHLDGQLARKRVLLARVVAAKQRHRLRSVTRQWWPRHLCLNTVTEARTLCRHPIADIAQRIEH